MPDAWLDRAEYPFASRFRELPAGRMHYVDEGVGRPLVLVHGVPSWSFGYRHLIRRLSARHRCVAMDHLGFGLSDKPTGGSYAPEVLARNVEALIEGLGLRSIALVVHDWGGPIGLAYALRHAANVRRLVVLNSWMWPSTVDLRSRVVARILASPLYDFLEDRFSFTARAFVPSVFGDRTKLTPAIHRHYLEPLRRREDRAGTRALARAVRGADPWLASLWQRREAIRGIPALIVWGLADRAFTRRDLERWKGMFSNARVHAFAGVGHFPQEEIGDELCELVEQLVAEP